MTLTYRVPASSGFEYEPSARVVSARVIRRGKTLKGVTPRVDGLSVTARSPLIKADDVNGKGGDRLEVVIEHVDMPGTR